MGRRSFAQELDSGTTTSGVRSRQHQQRQPSTRGARSRHAHGDELAAAADDDDYYDQVESALAEHRATRFLVQQSQRMNVDFRGSTRTVSQRFNDLRNGKLLSDISAQQRRRDQHNRSPNIRTQALKHQRKLLLNASKRLRNREASCALARRTNEHNNNEPESLAHMCAMEVAATLGEYIHLADEFRDVVPAGIRILLLEVGAEVALSDAQAVSPIDDNTAPLLLDSQLKTLCLAHSRVTDAFATVLLDNFGLPNNDSMATDLLNLCCSTSRESMSSSRSNINTDGEYGTNVAEESNENVVENESNNSGGWDDSDSESILVIQGVVKLSSIDLSFCSSISDLFVRTLSSAGTTGVRLDLLTKLCVAGCFDPESGRQALTIIAKPNSFPNLRVLDVSCSNWVTLEALSFSGLLVDPNNHTVYANEYEYESRYQTKLPLECAHESLKDIVLYDCTSLEHEQWDHLAKRKCQMATGHERCCFIDEKVEDTSTWLNDDEDEDDVTNTTTTSVYGNQAPSDDSLVDEEVCEVQPTLLRTYHMQTRLPGSTCGYIGSCNRLQLNQQQPLTRMIRLHVTHRAGR